MKKKLNININMENIGEGQIIKNYRELCELTGMDIKAGDTKNAQLKELERFCKYHKDGIKIIIEKIYDKPLPKDVGNNKYVETIQDILIDYIYNNYPQNSEVRLSFSKLINILGLANNTYTIANYKKRELSEILNVELTAIYFFYNNTRSEFRRIIERALKNLQNRRILDYSMGYEIVTKDEAGIPHSNKATTQEQDKIICAETYALEDLGLTSPKELFLAGSKKYKKYNELIKKRLPKEWIYVYREYLLVVGSYAVKKEYNAIQERKKLNKLSVGRLTEKFNVTDGQENEKQLIDKLISLVNYDMGLDDRILNLYKQHEKEYSNMLTQKGKELNNIIKDKTDKECEIANIKDSYENSDVITNCDYMSYVSEMKFKKQAEELKDDINLF